jgi:hypothetical protein
MLAAPLAMALPVLGAVPAQAAESAVQSPRNGTVIRSGSSVTAKAHSDWAFKTEMRAVIPGSGDTFLTKRDIFAGALSAPISLRRYQVYLKTGLGQVIARSTFTVRIPPAQPSGVSAKASGGKLTVTWNLGLEDDVSGYTVSAGSAGSKSGSAGSLCSGTSCKATFSVPASASGSVPVNVRAKRPDGLGGSVSSNTASTSASVGSSSLPGGGSSSLPGSAPPNGSAPLTPFNNQSPVTLPSVQPDGASPGFAYPTPQVANQVAPKAENASAINSLQWGRSVGIALILLVVAAHLGTWTRRLRVAQAGLSGQGRAARTARGGSGRSRVRRAREQIARAEAVAKTSELVPPPEFAGVGKKPGARRTGDTAVRRRPATLGRARDGVDVRIAHPSEGSSALSSVADKKARPTTSRGRRRK